MTQLTPELIAQGWRPIEELIEPDDGYGFDDFEPCVQLLHSDQFSNFKSDYNLYYESDALLYKEGDWLTYFRILTPVTPNQVMIDKSDLEQLFKSVSFIRSTTGENQNKWFNEYDIHADKIRKQLEVMK